MPRVRGLDRGYMGARKGEPCMSYKDFIDTKRGFPVSNHMAVTVWRHKYRYYVHSWRALNDVA